MSVANPVRRRWLQAPAALAAGLAARALPGAGLLALAGCAGLGGPPPSADLSGRLSVRVDAEPVRHLSAAFELYGTSETGQLSLATPLGTLMARAEWRPGRAELITTDGRNAYPDLDTLAAEALGERVPLAALFDWLRGRPWREAASQPLADGGRGFMQLGWQVDLSRFEEGWVEARRPRQATAPAVLVRARLDRSA